MVPVDIGISGELFFDIKVDRDLGAQHSDNQQAHS